MSELTRREQAEKAIESLTDCCAMMAERSGGIRRGEGYTAWLAPESFWYHRVRLYSPASADDAAAVLAEVAGQTGSGALPPLICWLGQDDSEGYLSAAAKAAGFVPMTSQTAMYLSLAGRRPAAEEEQIARMPAEEVEQWSLINARAFGKPPDTGGLKLLAERNGDDTVFLTWREKGEVLGGALLACAGDNGGIHEVFTLPEHRGRGIATALARRCLDLAAAYGCAHATLQASAMGKSVYAALGMEDVGTVESWIFRPPA